MQNRVVLSYESAAAVMLDTGMKWMLLSDVRSASCDPVILSQAPDFLAMLTHAEHRSKGPDAAVVM